jgi:hypothetical protein
METFAIHPKDEAQRKALQNLTSTKTNKKRLDAALEADKKGEEVKVNFKRHLKWK